MNILIDTHVFLWLLKTPRKISPEHIAILKSPHTFFLSSISVAEMMTNDGKFALYDCSVV